MTVFNDYEYSKKLKALRKQSGIKQNVLAKELGYADHSVIRNLENGKREFTEQLIKKICSYFKISSSQFKQESKTIGKTKNKTVETTSNKKIQEELKLLHTKKAMAQIQFENIELHKNLEKTRAQMKNLHNLKTK